MTKLLLSALACFAFVATTSFVSAEADQSNPTPQEENQAPREAGEPEANPVN